MLPRKQFLLLVLLSILIAYIYGQVSLCQSNCLSSDRLVGPTRMNATKTHPWKVASYPSKNAGFCQLGCQIFYFEVPKQTTCHRLCKYFYRYNVTVGYSDLIEEARLECENGCDIALQVCQPGYYCDQGFMHPCGPGTFAPGVDNVSVVALEAARACTPCPYGRYRSLDKGKSPDDCSLCPVGTYASETGSKLASNCKRCPAGMNAEEPGMRFCKCITPGSCDLHVRNDPREYFGNGVDYYRETVPFIGRW